MNLLHIGHTIVRLDVVDSTNHYAANWLTRSIVSEGTVILARSQSHGKGQRGNSWISEDGQNLTFSVVLYPSFLPLERAHLLTHVAALALQASIGALCANTTIKWPNDLYCGNSKIAGILVENTILENKIKHAVMGIGLNVNQTHFPVDIKATSVKSETGKTWDLNELLNTILQHLNTYYLMLATGNIGRLHSEYMANLYMRNVKKTFLLKGKIVDGEIRRVNSNGKLVILTSEGELEADFKELSFQN
ncbi:MAG: biotin--[acetyl-CoA-carboxylase] ligase [Flavobacteriales bacterium]